MPTHGRAAGLVPADFAGYLRNETKVTFPWSMIDKITPRPDAKIKALLDSDGFEDSEVIVTAKNTYTSSFVNAEETEYLVIEDNYTCGTSSARSRMRPFYRTAKLSTRLKK